MQKPIGRYRLSENSRYQLPADYRYISSYVWPVTCKVSATI